MVYKNLWFTTVCGSTFFEGPGFAGAMLAFDKAEAVQVDTFSPDSVDRSTNVASPVNAACDWRDQSGLHRCINWHSHSREGNPGSAVTQANDVGYYFANASSDDVHQSSMNEQCASDALNAFFTNFWWNCRSPDSTSASSGFKSVRAAILPTSETIHRWQLPPTVGLTPPKSYSTARDLPLSRATSSLSTQVAPSLPEPVKSHTRQYHMPMTTLIECCTSAASDFPCLPLLSSCECKWLQCLSGQPQQRLLASSTHRQRQLLFSSM